MATVNVHALLDQLKVLYKTKAKPLEELYQFQNFHSPPLTDADLSAKPMVLLLGQYSTGKSTFIEYLLGRQYPGCTIGPEPTTDRFVAVMGSNQDRVIPGNAAAVSAELPFTALARFGTAFLNRFQVSQMACQALDEYILIDTPGILSGAKQTIDRNYDFTGVVSWFAERADLILLLFDAHKLDISDEFKACIQAIKSHDEKIRVVLNKADQVNQQQLLRVYGALMYSLGRVVRSPEVPRVYCGSFWNQPFRYKELESLFQAEMADLVNMLKELPRNAAIRKVNEIVKRVRTARVHGLIIGHLRSKMPAMFGKKDKQAELYANLPREFAQVQQQYQLAPGDFPDAQRFLERIKLFDLDKMAKPDKKVYAAVDELLAVDLPKLMTGVPQATLR
ncbi:P-loop containing nucleoside triphosphate hydrolase protein [Hyaloraphidium curvatum]|nr:P-loop containing nucleoside triphosphate hydrolase protein [Hyaloraphidium curvatum]